MLIKNKRCAHGGCPKHPSFGVAGTKKKQFRSAHKKEGMVDVANKSCAHRGCTKQASFGAAGTKNR